jgi:hypothetical protein
MEVVEITHVDDDGNDGEVVFCWGIREGMNTVKSCLRRGEMVRSSIIEMSETEFDSLEEYEGEC